MEVSGGFANTPRQQLRNLLDSVVVAARKDVHDYSSGHLNEANLYKPPEVANHKSWPSSKKPRIPVYPPSKLPSPPQNTNKLGSMKDTLVNFSLGTLGSVPLPPLKNPKAPNTQIQYDIDPSITGELVSPQQMPAGGIQSSRRVSQASKQSSRPAGGGASLVDENQLTSDGVFVEELNLPEIMLLRASQPQKGLGRPSIDVVMQHEILKGHLEAVTKKDQFNRLKFFERDVIGKQDASERRVMMGQKAVDHLEAKLIEELDSLEDDSYGPNFHRLQVYSGVFEELIDESPTFGFVLRRIKREYDSYMASLLDEPTGLNSVLQEQVVQLASHPSSNPAMLSLEQSRLEALEKKASHTLSENERLRKAVREEMNTPLEPEPEPMTDLAPSVDPMVEMDISETVESLKATILEKLDALQALRETLRKQYVPSTVCTHLEQCIKETEVEIQRLMSSKNYFEGNINEMERDLQDAIENADTTERDQRRVWKRVSAVKAGGSNKDANDSDYEQDESSKWDWYIS